MTAPSPWAWRSAPCSLPQTRRPNFEIGDDEMEIGMGIHGEPGVARGPLKTAGRHRRRDAWTRSSPKWRAARGDRVAVLVNWLGATSLMELYILNRRVASG